MPRENWMDKDKPKRLNPRSLVFRISVVIALILLMTMGLLLMYTFYAYKVTHDSLVETQRGAIAVTVNQISGEMKSVSKTLSEIANDYLLNASDYSSSDAFKRYLSSIRTASLLDQKMDNNMFIDALFFRYGDGKTVLVRYAQAMMWDEKFTINDYFNDNYELENGLIYDSWNLIELGGQPYLMQVYRMQNASFGVVVGADRLLRFTGVEDSDSRVEYAISNAAGTVLATSGDALAPGETIAPGDYASFRRGGERYYIVTMPIATSGLLFSFLWPSGPPLLGINSTAMLFVFLGVIIIAVITGFAFYLRRQIVVPIQSLLHATREIEHGELDYQINDTAGSQEFDTLISSFNYMTQEIKNLKIRSYEEKINKQRVELRYLQMQLKPHFYLNAISTISSLSMQGKNAEIEKYVLVLSEYLRYLITDNFSMVTIEEEVAHALAYVKLQQVFSPDNIFFMSDIDEAVREVGIPKLMLQTFVENIFKHAFDRQRVLSIFMSAHRTERAGTTYVELRIDDNGCGFEQAYLERNHEQETGHLGIKNIIRTLRLFYGQEDLLQLSNNEQGGARVVVNIPLSHDAL